MAQPPLDPRRVIDRVANDVIAPTLKAAGYRRSRRAWSLQRDGEAGENVAIVALQTRPGLGSSVEFTLTCGIWSALVAAGTGEESDPPAFDVWSCHMSYRLGELLRDRPPIDYWWLVDANTDEALLQRNFAAHTGDIVVPFVNSALDDAGLRDQLVRRLDEGTLWEPEIGYLLAIADRIGPPELSARVRAAREHQAGGEDDQASFVADVAEAMLEIGGHERFEPTNVIRTPPG